MIDALSPCLIDAKTGEITDTLYSRASDSELKNLQQQGWNFNWSDKSLSSSEIYRIIVRGNQQIQGLIAIIAVPNDKAVYVEIVESAPHNIGVNKHYQGVGGHLFAVAAKRSVELGYDGFLYFDAKNIELVEHYQSALGAVYIGQVNGLSYRMVIDEEAAKMLIGAYTLQEEA